LSLQSDLWQGASSVLVENDAFLDGMKSDRRDSVYSLFADGHIEIGGQTNIRGTIEIVSRTSILVQDSAS